MKNKKQVQIIKPADFIVMFFGGLRPAAKAIGRSHASVNKWRRPVSDRGTGGYIPRAVMHRILTLAEKNNWQITAYDLIIGRDAKNV